MLEVDNRIIAESVLISRDAYCEIRLVRDRDLTWFIIIPLIEGATELIDLNQAQQEKLLVEINKLSEVLKKTFHVDKINIGMIGNMVRQLHVHIIGRFETDRQFPKPIWGNRLDIAENDPVFVERLRQCSNLSHENAP